MAMIGDLACSVGFPFHLISVSSSRDIHNGLSWHSRQECRQTCKTMSRIPATNDSTGSSLSKQEHTVINIGDPDGVPRLVSDTFRS